MGSHSSRKSIKNIVRNKMVGVVDEALQASTRRNQSIISDYETLAVQHFDRIYQKLNDQEGQIQELKAILRTMHDDIAARRNALVGLRKTREYAAVFKNKKPLISVRIATWNRSKLLRERAIKSVLNQTYQNFEIIVVGDHCTDNTEEMIRDLGDPRIQFYNLPQQMLYPNEKIKKWQVIGALPMNIGAGLATGEWIAPLDDDDEFSPDHLETLLENALVNTAEVSYGALQRKNLVNNSTDRIYSDPPRYGAFSFMGAIYMRLLNDIFQYDQSSWVNDEPADWNMCRRMLEAGVRVMSVDKNVGLINMIPAGNKAKDY